MNYNSKKNTYKYDRVKEGNMNEEKEELEAFKRGSQKEREDIIGEHKFTDIGQLVLLFIYLVVWGIDSFYLHFSTFLGDYIPIYVTIPLGCIVLILAGYLAFKGLKQVFKEERDVPQVITTGVFGICRHPVYLGSILLFIGMTVLTWSLLSLGVCIIVIIFYEYVATYEEKLLVKQFGQAYEEYQRNVPKWVPMMKFFKRR